jgi:hypothetical protein
MLFNWKRDNISFLCIVSLYNLQTTTLSTVQRKHVILNREYVAALSDYTRSVLL